jgi:RNA polymerase sigma-70 factor, ECF subfamily
MAAARPSAKPTATSSVRPDGQPRDWAHDLRSGGQERQAAIARLRELLLAAARDEAGRRWQGQAEPGWRRGGTDAEPSDLSNRAADSALKAISAELVRYRADTRFTTWAYKYVMFGLSEAAGRRFWSSPPRPKEYDWKLLAAMRPADLTGSSREWRDTLAAVRRAVDLELSGSQRAIFAAVTLGHLPPEALTCGLGPDRNAIYRSLFEARRRVGSRLTADGLLHADDVPRQTATHLGWLRPLLAADPGDTGCDVAFQTLDRYAEADLAGSDPQPLFPGVSAHLAACLPCGQDYQGMLAAARSAGAGPSEPAPDTAQPA